MKRVIIANTNNTSLHDVLQTLKRFAYSVEELSDEDARIFEEATGLSISSVLDAHYDLHHQLYPVTMSADMKPARMQLRRVCEDFSQFVGTVENLSATDKQEFESITGFKLPQLLEMYSSLINKVNA